MLLYGVVTQDAACGDGDRCDERCAIEYQKAIHHRRLRTVAAFILYPRAHLQVATRCIAEGQWLVGLRGKDWNEEDETHG